MLDICPVSLAEANFFVAQHHRHHKPVTGHKFSIGCTDGENIVGVAIVGRPVSRYLDDGWTLEVNRLCTDGTKNACSMLYAAAWRAARAMGYKKLITYIGLDPAARGKGGEPMKRLTKIYPSGSYGIVGDIDDAVHRLAAIEDILGDEYELDRLRELWNAVYWRQFYPIFRGIMEIEAQWNTF